MTDSLTRKQRSALNQCRGILNDIADVIEAMLDGPSKERPQGVLELAHTAAALIRTGDSPGSGWKTDQTASSAVSDPTGNAVRLDEYVTALHRKNLKKLMRLREEAYSLYRQHTVLASYLTERPHQPPAGQGECLIDGEFVPGIAEDRIKRGLCPKHYRQWVRAGRPDITLYPEEPDVDDSPIRATFPGCDAEEAA